MFMQVILGKAADADLLRRQWESWLDSAPGATGWLGSVAGVTSDGRAAIVDRFSSVQAAEKTARGPDHRAWRSTTEELFEGPVNVLRTEDVAAQHVRDAAGAGFVQVMRAEVRSRARFEAIEREIGPAFAELRPDFLAGYRAWSPDATVVAVDYFRSESEARAGRPRRCPTTCEPASRSGSRSWRTPIGTT